MVNQKINVFRKWLSRLAKLAFILIAILAVFITILANMGGSSDSLKESTQDFVGSVFGGQAYIEKLVRLSFFPMVGMDVEKVQVTRPSVDDVNSKSDIIAVFSKIQMYMDFWDVTFGNAKFRKFYIEDGFLKNGIFGKKKLTIERAYVDHDREKNTAQIIGKGLYGDQPWLLTMNLDVHNGLVRPEYELTEKTAFELHVADVKLRGTILKSSDNFMKLENLILEDRSHKIQGDAYVSLIGDGVVQGKGKISLPGVENAVTFDLLFDLKTEPMKISGQLSADQIAIDNIFGNGSAYEFFDHIYYIFHGRPILESDGSALSNWLSDTNLELVAQAKSFSLNDKVLNDVSLKIEQRAGNIAMKSIKARDIDITAIVIIQTAFDERHRFQLLSSAQGVKAEDFESILKGFRASVKPISETVSCAAGSFSVKNGALVFNDFNLNKTGKEVLLETPDFIFAQTALGKGFEEPCFKEFKSAPIVTEKSVSQH